MKKTLSILTTLIISVFLVAVTTAQDPEPTTGKKTPLVKNRQKVQQKRIKHGVKNGELTVKETAKLEKEQKEIQKQKKEARADGTVTTEERKDLHKEQNQARKHIIKAKHNKKDRKP